MDHYTLKSLAQGDDDFLYLCLKKLYYNQTHYEQGIKKTYERNEVGFNHADAPVMSRYAEAAIKGLPLTMSELHDLRRRIRKYTAQLSNYVNDEDLP